MDATTPAHPERRALDKARALIVVPTYNERENIARIIEAALAQDPRLEMLIVDDGSPDGTAAIVEGIMERSARVHILKRAGKMGLGTAYIAGFRWGLERKYDFLFVVQMDADGSHDPADIDRLIAALDDVWSRLPIRRVA